MQSSLASTISAAATLYASQPERLAAETARVRGHSEFGHLLAEYCVEMTQQPPRWPLPKLLSHAVRFVICNTLIANYLRWQRDGDVLPTLAALQAHVMYASPRQIADFVAGLRKMGMVTVSPHQPDRRAKLLRPEGGLILETARHPGFAALAHARMFHAGGPLPPAPTSDWLSMLLLRTDDVALHDDWGLEVFPIVASFALRDAGYSILCAVMRCAHARLMPTACCTIPVSYDSLAERFHVSRTHVANLLREARASGWFAVENGSLATVDAAMVEQFEAFVAQQFAHFGLIAQDMGSM